MSDKYKRNRFIDVADFFKYMKCDRGIQQANCLYVSHSVSAYTACVCVCLSVCLSVCVWLWQGSFQTPQTLMNGSLCVHVCVCVCVCGQLKHLHSRFLINAKYSPPAYNTHTHTHNMLCAACRTITIPALTSCARCDSPEVAVSPARRRYSCHSPDLFWPINRWATLWLTPTYLSGNRLTLQTRDHD